MNTTATTAHAQLRVQLHALAAALKQAQLWDAAPPDAQALASTMPFMFDTLRIEQWLQWVFIARLHALIDARAALPTACSVRPLAEHEWIERQGRSDAPTQEALAILSRIDTLLSQPSTPC